MVKSDHDDPLDSIFNEVERMMNDMIGGDARFASETRIDVYDEGLTLRLVADPLDIDKDAIDLRCGGETLTIGAVGDHHECDGRVRPPARVDEYSASATFGNGILQVTFDHAEGSVAVDVE